MDDVTVRAIIFFSVIAVLVLVALWLYYSGQKTNSDTQRNITDRDLLRLISSQPDGLVSPHMLADQTDLSLNQARSRLNSLMLFGILSRSANRRGRYFFELVQRLEEPEPLELSPEPFLTVNDLLTIFPAFGNRVSAQDLIMATGLPLAIIKREMRFFEKEGIVQMLYKSDSNGVVKRRTFVLQEPYRSDHQKFRDKAGVLDLKMKDILLDENLLL